MPPAFVLSGFPRPNGIPPVMSSNLRSTSCTLRAVSLATLSDVDPALTQCRNGPGLCKFCSPCWARHGLKIVRAVPVHLYGEVSETELHWQERSVRADDNVSIARQKVSMILEQVLMTSKRSAALRVYEIIQRNGGGWCGSCPPYFDKTRRIPKAALGSGSKTRFAVHTVTNNISRHETLSHRKRSTMYKPYPIRLPYSPLQHSSGRRRDANLT